MLKNSKQSIIEDKLKQRPIDSKKAIYALIGAACVLLVFGISAGLILFHAEQAKEITELANLVIMFFAAITTTILTGQAVVDFKGMSVLQHLDEDQRIESNQALPQYQVNTTELRRDPKDYLIAHDTSF
jgi:heme/copper-type cytochrome/quinol oxidase subunit 2